MRYATVGRSSACDAGTPSSSASQPASPADLSYKFRLYDIPRENKAPAAAVFLPEDHLASKGGDRAWIEDHGGPARVSYIHTLEGVQGIQIFDKSTPRAVVARDRLGSFGRRLHFPWNSNSLHEPFTTTQERLWRAHCPFVKSRPLEHCLEFHLRALGTSCTS